MGYARSSYRDSESYLEIVVGLDEDDIQFIPIQNISNFVTYELSPSIYSIRDILKACYTMGDHEGTLQIKYDDFSMKTNHILTRCGSTFGTLGLEEKTFFNTIIGLTPYWDHKPTNANHADSPGVYTGGEILNLSILKNFHFKCDIIQGSIVNGKRQPLTFSFVLDKPFGYKVFCEPETIHHLKKISVLSTKTFYFEDDENKEVDFYQKMLTFTLQLIKI